MAGLILFDSDVLIDVLRKNYLAEILLTTLGSAGPLGTSIISRMETIRDAEMLRYNSKLRNCCAVFR